MAITEKTLKEKVTEMLEKVQHQFNDFLKRDESGNSGSQTENTNPEKLANATSEDSPVKKVYKLAKEYAFADYVLKDGTEIVCDTDTLGKGSALQVKKEDGNLIPIPDGEYEVKIDENNSALVKVEAGIVSDMMPVEAPKQEQEQAADSENKTPDYSSEIEAMKAKMADMEAMIQKIMDGGAKMQEESSGSNAVIIKLQKENQELSAIVSDTLKIVELMAATPTDEPTQKPSNTAVIPKSKVYTDPKELREKLTRG